MNKKQKEGVNLTRKNKLISLILASVMLLALLLSGCQLATQGGSGATAAPAPDADSDKYADEVVIDALRRSDDVKDMIQTLADDMWKEKFNMKVNIDYVSSSDMATKITTLFASGREPDFFWNVRPAWGSDEWTHAGYFRGFTYDELLEHLPVLETLWDWQSEDAWEYVWNYLVWSDGKVYTIPNARDSAGNMTWVYRQDAFDKIGQETFPETPDEFMDVLKRIKTELNITPLVDRNTNSGLFVISKWAQFWGLPDMLPDMPCFENPVTGKMYYYVFADEDYREVLKFTADLYKDGLLWNEYITATTEQVKAYIAEGNRALLFGYPESVPTYNKEQVDAVPDVNYQWTTTFPSVDTSKRQIKKDNYHLADLRAFAYSATDEQVERMCDWINWSGTDEGMTFHSFGVEGVTYDVIDGVKTIKDEFTTPLNPGKTDLAVYQIERFMWLHPEYTATYKPALSEWIDTVFNQEGVVYVLPSVMAYTDEENQRFVETKTYLTDAVNEWLLRFVSGEKDVYNDAHWAEYIGVLESLGLRDYEALNKEVYERSGN
jgi:putative aldouronate transport system substrate-binding protein